MRSSFLPKVVCILISFSGLSFAGGPIVVGGPATTIDGQPFVWDLSLGPIQYRVDAGPLSVNPSGTVVIDNTAGLQRVQSLFQPWASVPTTAIRYNYAGPILPAGSFTGGDLSTPQQFNDVSKSCDSGQQSPIIFDANGSLFDALIGDSLVIGFAGPCDLNFSTGKIVTGLAALNGRFLDGVNDGKNNRELSPDGFDAAMIHEFGHFSGLDHSQINVNCLHFGCSTPTESQGIPTMFPILLTAEQQTLSVDDQSWISKLYPNSNVSSSYQTISGHVFFSDGKTPAQGVNVIARSTSNPRVIAVSVVSGFKFTGNPGQTITANHLPCGPGCFADENAPDLRFGSRTSDNIGYYEMLVPPGRYTIEVESIDPMFDGGSSVGPLDPPISLPGGIPRFFSIGNTSTFTSTNHDDPYAFTAIDVSLDGASQPATVDIILEGTDPTFDQFEDPGAWLQPPSLERLLGKDVEVLA
jgi:hypothetical protein